jgi:hypothetical protein
VPGIFLGVKSGGRLGLKTLPPSVSRMPENVGASTSRNPKGLHGLYRDNFTYYFTFLHEKISSASHNHHFGGSGDFLLGSSYPEKIKAMIFYERNSVRTKVMVYYFFLIM